MPMNIRRRSLLAAAAGSFIALPRLAAAQDVQITGAGSSFVRPVMLSLIDLMPTSIGAKASYTAIGTGVAQSRILAGELDFAAVELPMPQDKLEAGELLQFPVTFGALVCIVNLPGVAKDELLLTGPLLAGIYGGVIRKWDDARIAEANPGVTLPDLDIRPVRLDTPSGSVFSTTFTFTQYLLATNPAWREKYGAAVPKRWAVGSMATSAELMVQTMDGMPGGIGYVPLGIAAGLGLTTVRMQNKAGKSVSASATTLQATVARVDWAKVTDLVPTVLDLPGDESWPIVLATYALIQRNPQDKARGAATRAFLKFAVSNGAEGATRAHAAALPAEAQAPVLKLLGQQVG